MNQRRRYPEEEGPERKVKSGRDAWIYSVFWKQPEQPSKGTIWLWCSRDLSRTFGIRSDEGIPFRTMGFRPSLLESRGVAWTAYWADGRSERFKASPQATKVLMAQIAGRWALPPMSLQKGTARPFDLASLVEESHSHVYLVRLLTFEPTADGRAYFKIGKAVSIPKRIKQFGPCEVIAEAMLPSEAESLKAEALLHQQFSQWRKPETEIFCFGAEQIEAVAAAMAQLRSDACQKDP